MATDIESINCHHLCHQTVATPKREQSRYVRYHFLLLGGREYSISDFSVSLSPL